MLRIINKALLIVGATELASALQTDESFSTDNFASKMTNAGTIARQTLATYKDSGREKFLNEMKT
jgi:hypothetical protein